MYYGFPFGAWSTGRAALDAASHAASLLLETAEYLLLETGDTLLLE